uniref:START domain-containing protein n=1 Tax=Haemonchus contortus TaxID=6289 RepID=A0A7I5ECV6_HAECO
MEGVTTENSSEKGIPHELEREVKRNVASLQREAGRKDEAMEVQDAFDWTDICRSLETTFNIDGFDNTGVGRRRGTKGESFEEFPRRFERKYKQVIKCEATLIEILGDDHLCTWAPESAILLERDGPRGGVYTRVVKSFESLRNTLVDWTTYGTWIIVLPIEGKAAGSTIEEPVKMARTHLEEGGRIVTVWTPVTPNTCRMDFYVRIMDYNRRDAQEVRWA